MDSLCGKVHFNTTDQYAAGHDADASSSPIEERRYIRVNYDVSLQTLAEFMVTSWGLGSPDIMISMISGVHQAKAWKKAEHRSALQRGIVKLANTSQAWIFTHGLNYGLARLIGDAVREDQDRRAVRGNWSYMAHVAYNQRVMQPRLIGVVPDALLNNPDQYLHGVGNVEIDTEEFERPKKKYEMNPNHNVFVLVNNTSYTATAVFRGQLERGLQAAASAKKEAARAATIPTVNLKPEDEYYEPSGIFDPETALKPKNYAMPLVCILIQGGPPEIDQVLYYLNDNVPVIVIKGTGLMADLLAFAYEEIMERGGMDLEMHHIKPEIENKMIRYFPSDFKDNETERHAYLEKILQCVSASHKQDRKYITICDLALSDADLADLDWFILKALFACQSPYAFLKRETIRKNLMLTVMWNRSDLAKSEIFQRDFSPANLRIDGEIFEQALLMRDRHAFVDMFLQQGFQLSFFVTAAQLKTLYSKTEDREFFVTVVWEGILEKSPAAPLKDKFVDVKLNEIVEHLTGIRDFVTIQETSHGLRGEPIIMDHAAAERAAINALIVWAVLMNRVELVKVLWKFSEQPIPLALFISSLYKGLSYFAASSEVEKKTNENGKYFGSLAVDVLHLSYQDATNRAFEVLAEPFEDFENMTPMDLSYRVGNKHFIAHPCSQRYLNEVFNGGIRVVKGPGSLQTPDFVKIILSSLLIFPMFFWITFPRLEAIERDSKEKEKQHGFLIAQSSAAKVHGPGPPSPSGSTRTVTTNAELVELVAKKSANTGFSQNIYSTLYVAETQKEAEVVVLGAKNSEGGLSRLTMGAGDVTLKRIRKDSEFPEVSTWKLWMNKWQLCCLRQKGTGNTHTQFNEASTAKKLYCLWNAPVTKFWMYQLNYWCFLGVLSVATFLPGCGEFYLDLTVFVWTWLNLLEYMCRTYLEYIWRRMISLTGRLIEMFLIFSFLAAYLFARLLPASFRMDNYSTKILMCGALLFFYYRLVFSFFPISRKLGPMLEKIKLMTSVDFVVFLKMVTPFMIASAVAMQTALFPDYPLGWESIRMTFHRAFFSLFLTPANDLQVENFARCSPYRIQDLTAPQPKERSDLCWAGTHSRHDCPVVGFSSYSIVIQYSIILKMILMTLLSAMFFNTFSGIDREADAVWKYQRYQVVLDFSTRPALPAPFSLVSYSITFLTVCAKYCASIIRRIRRKQETKPPKLLPRKGDFFKYWKAMVREHSRNLDVAAKIANLPKEQFKKIQGLGEDLSRQRSNWYRMRERIITLEKNVIEIRKTVTSPPSVEEPKQDHSEPHGKFSFKSKFRHP